LIDRGCACGDGWFTLIFLACNSIVVSARKAGIDKDSPEYPVMLQIKEKFGALEMYCSGGESIGKEIFAITATARRMSLEKCEICGEAGGEITKPNGYIQTLCEKCEKLSSTPPTRGGDYSIS